MFKLTLKGMELTHECSSSEAWAIIQGAHVIAIACQEPQVVSLDEFEFVVSHDGRYAVMTDEHEGDFIIAFMRAQDSAFTLASRLAWITGKTVVVRDRLLLDSNRRGRMIRRCFGAKIAEDYIKARKEELGY